MPWLIRLRRCVLMPALRMLVCSLPSLTDKPAVAEKVRLEQLRRLTILVTVMSATGLWTVGLIGWEYWRTTRHELFLVLAGSVVLCYAILVAMSVHCRFGKRIALGGLRRTLSRYTLVSAALGSAWGLLTILLMETVGPDGRSVLYAVIVGLMSAGVLVTPPSIAFAFWLPVTIGGTVALTIVSTARDFAGAVLLTGYTGLSVFCLLYLNRSMIDRVLAEVDQSEGRETINMLLRDFEDSAADWLWETDENGSIRRGEGRFALATKEPQTAILGQELVAFINRRRHRPRSLEGRRPPNTPELASFMACQMPFRDLEVMLEVEGRVVCWSLSGKPRFSEQLIFEGYRGVASDVTARKVAANQAEYLAHFDDMTGLANRRLFREALGRRLTDSAGGSVALLCLDLDGFKAINDAYGHPVGDRLLMSVARRLQRQVRDSDLVARLGGDEFAVVVSEGSPEVIESLATRLVSEISRPYEMEGRQLRIGVSIGIAMTSDGGRTEEGLQRDADTALYQAKEDGRGRLRFYNQSLRDLADRRRLLESELSEAIRQDRMHLTYQPIFALSGGNLHGVEALVRWTRRSGEALSPAEFVPLAESSRAIDELGAWVLMRACREAALLPGGIRLAVNVSAVQFRGRQLIEHVDRALLTTGLDERRLELELTETALLEMSEATLDVLRELHGRGIGICLDDFGVGHTSLSQLRRFPFTKLKIDRSFVQDLPTNPAARAIVRGLTYMASDMAMSVIAEGVETFEQLMLVRRAGCHFAQGYLLSRPVAVDGLAQAMQRGREMLMAPQELNAD